MRHQERRRQIWAIIDQKKAEIAQLKAQVRSDGLKNLLDLAFGNLEFSRQVLGNSTEVFKYPGAEEDEETLFAAVDLFLRVAANRFERARNVFEEFGPDADPL